MERKDLLLGSFLARALDLMVSACGFLSSSLSPEAATHYLHLPSIVSLDTFAHAHRAFNLTPSPGPKKLSNVFIIIRHHHSLPLICPFKKNQPSPLLTLRTLTLHTGQYLRIKVPSYKEVEGSALGEKRSREKPGEARRPGKKGGGGEEGKEEKPPRSLPAAIPQDLPASPGSQGRESPGFEERSEV